MNYWRINTDQAGIYGRKSCDIWYEKGMAFAGDPVDDINVINYNKLRYIHFFEKVNRGDGIFMHQSNEVL